MLKRVSFSLAVIVLFSFSNALANGDWVNYPTTECPGVNNLALEGDSVLWSVTFGGSFGGIVRWNLTDDTYKRYTTADGLTSNSVSAVAIDNQNNKWFGTAGGVSVFDGSSWTTYTEADGLASNSVSAVAIDNQNNKWFGTAGGVSVFDGSSWTTYTEADGLVSNHIIAIAIDNQGNKWVATSGNYPWQGGVSMYDGSSWTTHITGAANSDIRAIAIDNQNNKWVGTFDRGVSMFDGSSWTTYTTDDGLVDNFVHAIAIDILGNKWFGTDAGVSMYDGSSWTTYTEADGLAQNCVRAIVIDSLGNKWFGTDAGGVSMLLAASINGDVNENETPDTTETSSIVGDVNESGNVDIFDLLELLKVLSENSQRPTADTDGNGRVDIFDLLALLRILSGSSTYLASVDSDLKGTYSGLEYVINDRCKIIFPDGSQMEFSRDIAFPQEIGASGRIAASILEREVKSRVLPKIFSLSQNSPNPFNPSTNISYSIPEGISEHVSLKVYDLRGRLVRTLKDKMEDTGRYTVFWDGKEYSGRQVPSGVYLYRIKAGNFVQTRKMVLVK